MISALLIDDDINLREGMTGLLAMYAPDIEIIGEADSVSSGIEALLTLKPKVVFLDIQMVDGTGFDILEKIAEINGKISFHIVFITAYEHFAIKAFKFSALDFLLKPVNPDELEKVIEKIRNVLNNDNDYSHIDLLLENIRENTNNFKRIALTSSDGLQLVNINEIISCENIDDKTKFIFSNKNPIIVSKALLEYEDMLHEHNFFRIHQKHLINLSYVKSYMFNIDSTIIMTDDRKLPVSDRKIEQLREVLLKR